MSGWLIALVGFIYAAISIEQFMKHNPGMGIIFFGYALANAGMWWIAE
jgi:tellurite resistance protein TehA-like permease